jgi:hypothetical protein
VSAGSLEISELGGGEINPGRGKIKYPTPKKNINAKIYFDMT